MVDSGRAPAGRQASQGHMTKKCPECYTYMPLDAGVCPGCNRKIGEVDTLGFAKKPFDWRAYLSAVICIGAFAVFIWWGFIRE